MKNDEKKERLRKTLEALEKIREEEAGSTGMAKAFEDAKRGKHGKKGRPDHT